MDLAAQADAAGVEPAEIERRMARRDPTRTLIDASQVAALIAFLASPLSVSVNGGVDRARRRDARRDPLLAGSGA